MSKVALYLKAINKVKSSLQQALTLLYECSRVKHGINMNKYK